ncbi:MAG: 30S ribosomal protein S12 methylthiotransferase RimO [Calditrichales bacterium]|nr:30S ribosomal protein S12 methylthiotransferase RimO [Calditrichales bacterium]
MKKIHITTLGCSKNLVDSEVLMGQLEYNHFEVIDQPEDADVIILNTCGFIEEAKEESVQAIFEALKLKKDNPAKKVFAAGCLTQRYHREILKEIPEIDAVFGTEAYAKILQALGRPEAALNNLYCRRKISAPCHYAYLKISEGCNHTCSFCAIPAIRGSHRSRTIESLLEEAKKLCQQGVKELILISQDTSYYGKDLYNKQRIVDLLEALHKVDGVEWIRTLYWYPANFSIEALDLMKSGGKLLPYIDMPVQHISDRMLRIMRRGDTRASIIKLLDKIRAEIPDAALRSTLILGHPGEREEDFQELLQFVKDIQFDRLGAFVYSDEEHTSAYSLKGKVKAYIAGQHYQQIMEVQRDISLQKNVSFIGKRLKVLLDDFDPAASVFTARTYRDAPEIDNEVLINVDDKTSLPKPGDFVTVQIEDVSEYELYGKLTAGDCA